jgi:hypothetical protein
MLTATLCTVRETASLNIHNTTDTTSKPRHGNPGETIIAHLVDGYAHSLKQPHCPNNIQNPDIADLMPATLSLAAMPFI